MAQERNTGLLRLADLMAMLRRQPRTLAECAKQLGVTTRTIYRDLTTLETIGVIVVNTEESGNRGLYSIERGAPCPLCQRNK